MVPLGASSVRRATRQRDLGCRVRIEEVLRRRVTCALRARDPFFDGALLLVAEGGVCDRCLPKLHVADATVLVATS